MKYKNVSKQDLWLPGIGHVEAGAEVTTQKPLINANFELVSKAERPEDNKAKAPEAPKPGTTK